MHRFSGFCFVLALGCGGASVTPQFVEELEEGPRVTLRLTEAPDEADIPQTQVQLVLLWGDGVRQVLDVGRRPGACHEIQMPRSLPRVSCWWGPQQVEIEVSQSGSQVIVQAVARDGEEPEELLRAPLRLEGPLRPWRARQPEAGVAAER